ncbi:helix-turn-helix domain-containing protein [Lentzea aerocolonigenes]|uniref:helix-turn-helix domain-containing protein n=1 Tax=Lentzea aerocolonigenes TaxID=68170 RepID=UPI0004C40DF5|nr:helix-turn-helix transcriptional regulator [Lentzea aerocolonigenes]MCP2243504.1 Helix-turn-helix domain-containing protein [Lentzea aerocolonigenes]
MGGKREAFAARREAMGFTQEGLAAAVGVEFYTVGRWERGVLTPQPWRRPRIAKALDVSLEELNVLLDSPDLPQPVTGQVLMGRPPQTSLVPSSPASAVTADQVDASDAFGPEIAEHVRRSREEWLRVRRAAGARGRELTELAAWLYPVSKRAPGGHVLTGPDWLLDTPVELNSVRLKFSEVERPVSKLKPVDHVLPLTARGERYAGYSRAVRDLVRPRLLENRLSYRLLEVSQCNGLELTFGTTTFFEVFDIKECLAHEFKAAWLASGGSVPDWSALPLRSTIGDPFDPARMLMSPGISTLTIRKDRRGEHRFMMHQRDGRAVADGGGMCTVMPSGEFQPSSLAAVDVHNDFSLWRNIMREYSEEFLGNPEHDGAGTSSIDYAEQEPFRSFEQARADGRFRLWHYGLVMDALTLGASQRTVAVLDDEIFDRLFTGLVATNDEGHVVGEGGRTDMPFTSEAIDRLEPRLSASSLTLLRLAWRDRQLLLG